ncbi:MAG: hypothetical protein V1835_06140, partial [Candidatus Micrarchaeota archaeon]
FLLDEWETDFSTVEVADEAGLTWKSVAPIMPYLEKQGLIKKTRTIGRATMYKLNAQSPLLQELKKLDFLISGGNTNNGGMKKPVKATIRIIRKKGSI